MKSKGRHHNSSDDSDESDANANGSSSGIDSGHSLTSEQHTKKRKRANSSDSDSDSDEQKRSQKRKQKKKMHGMKKRCSVAVAGSVSGPVSTTSEGEISSNTKRQRSSSVSAKDEKQIQHRLHSVVVKRRGSCKETIQTIRIYYNQKEYQTSASPEENKELRSPKEEYQRRPREQEGKYHQREDTRVFNYYNQHEERGGRKRREFEGRRDYRESRGPPDNCRLRDRGFPDRKERYHVEGFASGRPREVHREKLHNRERPTSRCQEERHRRAEGRAGREEQYGVRCVNERMERCGRHNKQNVKQERPLVKTEPWSRDRKSRFSDPDENKEYDWGDVKMEAGKNSAEKVKPNFGLSGKLTADANTVNAVVIKYTEPDDAKLPIRRWRIYPFKGNKALPILFIHRQSAFLIGRDKKVVDIALAHPSISKQHAALQYRAMPFTRPDGTQGRRVRPYVIDLESANGTFVNHKKLEPRRYVELLEQDVIKFGFSQREYVLLHENSKDEEQDDEHQEPSTIGGVET